MYQWVWLAHIDDVPHSLARHHKLRGPSQRRHKQPALRGEQDGGAQPVHTVSHKDTVSLKLGCVPELYWSRWCMSRSRCLGHSRSHTHPPCLQGLLQREGGGRQLLPVTTSTPPAAGRQGTGQAGAYPPISLTLGCSTAEQERGRQKRGP